MTVLLSPDAYIQLMRIGIGALIVFFGGATLGFWPLQSPGGYVVMIYLSLLAAMVFYEFYRSVENI